MKELVVISGKGGAGKTSVTASLAAMAKPCVLVDCDVDAADLHLVVEPTIEERNPFSGGKIARIRSGHCTACGKCQEFCAFEAIFFDGPGNGFVERTFRVDEYACEGCGLCYDFCPVGAVEFKDRQSGNWFVSSSRFGPMVHARLGTGEENSGKLVALIREKARDIAQARGFEWVIIDGPPGIGCPVIATLTGAQAVLLVAEPTVSGVHDVKRARKLTAHFKIPTYLCVNKADLNKDTAESLVRWAGDNDVSYVGAIRYSTVVTEAQVARKSLVEFSDGPAAGEMRGIWENLKRLTGEDGVA